MKGAYRWEYSPYPWVRRTVPFGVVGIAGVSGFGPPVGVSGVSGFGPPVGVSGFWLPVAGTMRRSMGTLWPTPAEARLLSPPRHAPSQP